ncbi:extracellular solute-binding protein [Candidatus Mycobacterium methanotrophicum]|uniref:Extracellular solute-binding protein n=1 Tax=Candidatus Mycobacterium methanotrophicum TaxID=2943498 RepID=A0ABY4QPH9_9MYCO|nr:extracellular solute-binding protein [Candidatus Mycobacterium methanotrophicum]UQX12779.1 extracellular solute-binding protein [Candidatus Mycobacterium methanotrophicum]
MTRPRFSTLFGLALVLVAALLASTAVLLDVSARPRGGKTVVTVRLWDEQVAAAYRQSFAAFARAHPDIEVHTHVASYATYFNTLRTDVAGGSADDIFWISNAYLAGYADSGRLMDIGKNLGARAASAWEPSVVEQFTRSGVLWAVPQLTDAGIALYYNADLLAAAGIGAAELATLRWRPDGGDTLRPMLARLTVDADGRTAATPGFDAGRIRQWAYNAANDAQGIYLNYIGSAGGVFQNGDRFAFDNPGAVEAFTYLVRLINGDHVAPPASDTNDNGDFSRNQFLAGRMALFQSGTYNLAAVADQAPFRWGVAMLPEGPKGRVSVTNGIAAAGNSASAHPDAVRQVLAWMGSSEGNQYVGRRGSAIPAVRSAQRVYFDYWATKNIDVRPFFTVLNGPRIDAPGGAGFAAGNQVLEPYFDEMFLGRSDVATTLRQAQNAANAAARR